MSSAELNLMGVGIVLAICLFGFTGTSCSPKPTTILRDSTEKKEASRFRVTLTDIIEDGLAYGSRRGIYLIRDTDTGQEFVGVSGIGISELGSHRSGKSPIWEDPVAR